MESIDEVLSNHHTQKPTRERERRMAKEIAGHTYRTDGKRSENERTTEKKLHIALTMSVSDGENKWDEYRG